MVVRTTGYLASDGERAVYLICVNGVIAEDKASETTSATFFIRLFPRARNHNLLKRSERFKKCLDSLFINSNLPKMKQWQYENPMRNNGGPKRNLMNGRYRLIKFALVLRDVERSVHPRPFNTDHSPVKTGILSFLERVRCFLCCSILDERKWTISPVFKDLDIQ